jgi:hypothetical protein
LGAGRCSRGSKEQRHVVTWRKTTGKSGFRIRRGDFRRTWFGYPDSDRDHLDMFLTAVCWLFACGSRSAHMRHVCGVISRADVTLLGGVRAALRNAHQAGKLGRLVWFLNWSTFRFKVSI